MARDEKSIKSTAMSFWRKKVKPFWREYEVPVLMIVSIAAFIMGVVGFRDYFNARGTGRPPLDWLYLTIVMFRGFFLEAGPLPPELEVSRWIAIFVVLYAVLRIIASLFYEQVHLLALRWLASGHVIVCGLGNGGAMMAREFYRLGSSVAVIDKNLSKEMAEKCKEEGAVILNGDATEKEFLRRARIGRAKYLVSSLDDDGENAGVALAARELIEERGRRKGVPLTCYVHVMDRRLCNLLKADFEFNTKNSSPVRLEFFNIYDSGSRALLREYPPFSGKGKDEHIGIVGMGRLGEGLILQAATDWLFYRSSAGLRFSVTLIDESASKKKAWLLQRYPLLENTCEIFASDSEVAGLSGPGVPGQNAPGTIYVCLDNDTDCLSAALLLRGRGTRVVACIGRSSGLSKLIENTEYGGQGTGGLRIFAVLDAACRPDVLLGGTRETIAMAIHEDYVRAQEELGFTPGTNPSMSSWETLPEELRESNRHNADNILLKLRAVGCGIELLTDDGALDFTFSGPEVETMALIEHERWAGERLAQGWKYAPGPKDIEKKTSPYIVPWERLSEEIRDYDRNVVRALPLFLARAGFQIYRVKPLLAVRQAEVPVRSG